jgi:hypothetical protein
VAATTGFNSETFTGLLNFRTPCPPASTGPPWRARSPIWPATRSEPTWSGPLRACPGLDSDSDGLTDEFELRYGLDRFSDDQNHNGIPDGQEDWDNDGLTNAQEMLLGTNPFNPHSVSATLLDSQLEPRRRPSLRW